VFLLFIFFLIFFIRNILNWEKKEQEEEKKTKYIVSRQNSNLKVFNFLTEQKRHTDSYKIS
jgi:hypothetical protein